ncbi:hypothetical protein GW915_06880 [bacterium]|nr:hypothetical protein [bacterium]
MVGFRKSVVFFSLLFLASSFSQAKGWVFKVSANKNGAIAEVEPYSHYPDQKLVLLRGGKEVGRANLLRFTKRDQRYALIKLTSGEISEGFVVEDAQLFDEGVSSLKKKSRSNNEEGEEDFAEDKPSETSSKSGGVFISALVGYDKELKESLIQQGFSFAGILGYRTPIDLSLGIRVGRSSLSLKSTSVTVGTTTVKTDPGNLTVLYMLGRLGYHFSNYFYLGANAGFVRSSYESESESNPGIGGELVIDIPLSTMLSLTLNASTIYVMDDDSDFLGVAGHGGFSLWF